MSVNDSDSVHYGETHDIILKVGNKRFFSEKQILRDKCPYFEAMFSGTFIEDTQKEVLIEMISSNEMKFVLDYLHLNTVKAIDLASAPELIAAVNFFQLQNLHTLVVQKLTAAINMDTWLEILQISKYCNLPNLESKSRSFGLYHFQEIRKNIHSIDTLLTLHWYLSHISLNSSNEYEVFETGCDWLNNKQKDDILVILSCLNFMCINRCSLKKILKNDFVQKNDIAVQIVKSVLYILDKNKTVADITAENFKSKFCKRFDDNIYEILCGLILTTKSRIAPVRPCIAGKLNEHLYIMSLNLKTNQLVKRLKIADNAWWGYNVLPWKGFNILILCGETKRGKNIWNKNIQLYNCLEEKWTVINSTPVPPRRHAAVVIHDDCLYLIGGVGFYRVTLASVLKYDLRTDTWYPLPDLPEHCQLPVATFHKNELYVSADSLYVFRNCQWVRVCKVYSRHNAIISFRDNLFYTQNWKTALNCWESKEYMTQEESISKLCNFNVSSMCQSDNIIYFFTETEEFIKSIVCIERCNLDDTTSLTTDILWKNDDESLIYYNTAGCFTIPELDIEDKSINTYGHRWLES